MISFLRSTVEPWYIAFVVANLVMGLSSVLIPLKLDRILQQGPTQLGLLSSIASVAAVLGSLLWGRLSDAAHRRKAFVVLSYVAVGFAHLGLAWASSFAQLMLYNTILSFFWIANASVAVLLIIERTEQETWEARISALNIMGTLGWLAGLVIGGLSISIILAKLSQQSGVKTLLVLLAMCSFLAALIAAWLVPVTKAQFTKRKFRGTRVAVGNLITEMWKFSPMHLYHRFSPTRLSHLKRGTRMFLLASFLAFSGIGFFAVPLPLLLSQRLGFSPSLVFYAFVMLQVGVVVAYPFAYLRIKRRGNRRVQMGALGARLTLFGIAAGALWFAKDLPWPVVALFLFLVGVTWSFFQLSGIAYASRLADPENRGLALGAYNAVAGGSTILAGVSSGYMAQHLGHHATYLVAVLLLLCAVGVLRGLPDPAILPHTNECDSVTPNPVRDPSKGEHPQDKTEGR